MICVIWGCNGYCAVVSSPDGHIRLTFTLDGYSQLSYSISVDDSLFIAPSALGLVEKNGLPLSRSLAVAHVDLAQRMKCGSNLGEKIRTSGTSITRWLCICLMVLEWI